VTLRLPCADAFRTATSVFVHSSVAVCNLEKMFRLCTKKGVTAKKVPQSTTLAPTVASTVVCASSLFVSTLVSGLFVHYTTRTYVRLCVALILILRCCYKTVALFGVAPVARSPKKAGSTRLLRIDEPQLLPFFFFFFYFIT